MSPPATDVDEAAVDESIDETTTFDRMTQTNDVTDVDAIGVLEDPVVTDEGDW